MIFLLLAGGPGGYVAALRAAQLGLKTALVERDRVGGVCLNWGCIPTKAFLRSSEIYRYLLHSAEYGLSLENPGFDLKAIVARSRRVAERLSHGVDYLLKKRKVPVIQGEARLEKGREAPHVIVKMSSGEEQRYQARHVILATGAHARTLPKAGLEPDGKFIWTYKQALQPDIMPKSLLVIGSGAIGVEFASFFSTLGAKTMMVEMADRILPAEDHEIAAFAHKQFQAQGMEIRTKAQTTHLEKREESVLAHIKNDTGETEVFEAGRVILAIGIEANTEGLGLEALGVQMERGHVLTDEFSATDCPGLYAIGDITAPPWLAHKASHEAVVCVEALAGLHPHALDPTRIPGCTYSHPQIASVGLTEEQAQKTGKNLKIGRFPFHGNGKAIALGETEGLVKTIFDGDTGELLGAHMVGAEVTELIQGYAITQTGELTEEELMQTVFPHPTLSEMMHESVLEAYGRAVHI